MNILHRTLPWVVVLLAIVFLVGQGMRGKPEGPYDLHGFGSIPVTADGRVKPLDTVARTTLMIASGKQTFEREGRRDPAIHWLADMMARPDIAAEYRVFRVDHPEVQMLIGQQTPSGFYFTFKEIQPHRDAIIEQAQRASQVPAAQRSTYQRGVLELSRKIMLAEDLNLWRPTAPYVIPPIWGNDQWAPFVEALQDAIASGERDFAVDSIVRIMSAYHTQDPQAFNTAVANYRAAFADAMPATARKANIEVFFNRFAPFYQATALYVLAFLLACASFLMRSTASGRWAKTLGEAAFWLLVVTFLLHTLGLSMRIYLQGRPPVTNLYSSAVFVGWGTVLLALFMERIYRLGLGSMSAAVVGFVTLIIAHNLGGGGDTMQMMQAVLDSNFWLATHVIVITIGYSATFLAGFLGLAYILLGVYSKQLTPDVEKALTKMVYGTICFALLFSFVGTVLGGIWADQSWGRFWGWDPKENGAALIVLMHALILHARWGGMIRARGMMVLAVAGNIICVWAWFGTNMLGVGLHSYGFMDKAMFWMMAFIISQVIVMAVGMIPLDAWRSTMIRSARTS